MPCLTPGDRVYVRDQGRYGKVVEKLNEPRSYRVKVGGDNIIQRNRMSLIHTGLDNENKLPLPTLPTTPTKRLPNSPVKKTPESTKNIEISLPSTPKLTTPEPVSVLPSDSENRQTTRIGRVVKCNRQPEMFYYK